MSLVVALQLARVAMSAAAELDVHFAAHDGADPLEPRTQSPQLFRREVELDLEVVQRRRAGRREMPYEEVVLVAGELRAAERVDERKRLAREEDRFPAMDAQLVDVRAPRELEVPRVLRPRPGAEAAAARLVGLFMAGGEQAGQRRIGGAGQEAAVA